jgi:hypothetical protein
MARRATIIGQVTDAFGDGWDVRERRQTLHGWDVCLGWPHGQPKGGHGSGGPQVIPTAELVAHLETHRRSNFAAMQLPIGAGAIKRLRRMLGHDRYLDARAWWEERIDDLSDLTLDQFAAKHGRKVGAIESARLSLLGKRLRDAGWWREDAAREALTSDYPTSFVATVLGISVGSVRRLRSSLKAE